MQKKSEKKNEMHILSLVFLWTNKCGGVTVYLVIANKTQSSSWASCKELMCK